MKSKMHQQLCAWLVGFALTIAPPLFAQSEAADEAQADAAGPGQIVASATDRIMAVVANASSYFETDPERYYREIGAELDAIVDFRSFARGVMGDAASSATYRALDEAEKAQLKDQLDRFTAAIRSGLIRTYGKGLLAFGGSRTEVAEATLAADNARIASVTQRVFSEDGATYTLRYQMGQYRDGNWRLRNMIIENVNLGEVYRSQFDEALASADNNIDRVIAEWNINSQGMED